MRLAVSSVLISLILMAGLSYAADCPLHSGATTSTAFEGRFNIRLSYDYAFMKTLRAGTQSVSPNKVVDDKLADPSVLRFNVPIKMIMQRYTLGAGYAPSGKVQLSVSVPYVINDMWMRMAVSDGLGTITIEDMKMDTIQGLGDATVIGYYRVKGDGKDGTSASLGLGVKTPTGKNDERKSSGRLVHADMQVGTGSWDPLFLAEANYRAGKASAGINALYHMTTEGDMGYEFGDRLNIGATGRYEVWGPATAGLGISYVRAGRDSDSEGQYSNTTSLADDTANTGISAAYVTPEITLKLREKGTLNLSYQAPVYQKANGIQQVLDWKVGVSAGWAF